MSKPSLGEDIVAVQNFLRTVHKQLVALLESLDKQMSREQWSYTNPNVTSEIGPSLNWERWLVSYLYRSYVSELQGRDWVTGVVIRLDPPKGYTVPVCLAFVAHFPTLQTKEEINSWEDTTPIFSAFKGDLTDWPPIARLEPAVRSKFFPHATDVWGFVIPLCSLTGEEDLKTRVVYRLLKDGQVRPLKSGDSVTPKSS